MRAVVASRWMSHVKVSNEWINGSVHKRLHRTLKVLFSVVKCLTQLVKNAWVNKTNHLLLLFDLYSVRWHCICIKHQTMHLGKNSFLRVWLIKDGSIL